MNLHFSGSNTPTIGVEIELQILDPDSLDLTPQSEKILQLCQEYGLERVKTEIHQSMLEIDSEICLNVQECKNYLRGRLIRLNEIAEASGLKLGITGTHPFQHWKERLISNQERYLSLHDKFQWLVRRMNVYGVHVHIAMPSGNHALAISRATMRYLPILLALSANSPFWQGIATGMQSSRVNILESFPYSGLPLSFASWHEFEHYYSSLHRVGAIHSLKDLYWYIRPNLSFGTIEFRICDTMSTLSETMALVALIHCLTVSIHEEMKNGSYNESWTLEHQWIAPHNLWIAARDGLEGTIVTDPMGNTEKISDAIISLIDRLSPVASRLDCKEELFFVKQIVTQGNGAQRQLATFAKTSSLRDVVAMANREFQEDLQENLCSISSPN